MPFIPEVRHADGSRVVEEGQTHLCLYRRHPSRRTPAGGPVQYATSETHAATALIIVNEIGHIALVRRNEDEAQEGGKLALPGGGINKHDTIAHTVSDEGLDESGYKLQGEPVLLAIMDGPPNLPGRRHEDTGALVLVHTAVAGPKVQEPNRDEVSEVIWVDPDALPGMMDQEAFGHFTIVAIWQHHLSKTSPPPLPLRPSQMTREELLPAGWPA